MQILGATIELSAQRHYTAVEQQRERLELRVEARPGADTVQISPEARQAAAADAVDDGDGSTTLDRNLQFLVALIEALTGRAVRLFDASDIGDAADAAVTAPLPGPGEVAIDYQAERHRREQETTSVRADGLVLTADGRRIRFSLELVMQRSYAESSHVRLQIGTPQRRDPLVLNFDGSAAELVDRRIDFDLDGDGRGESIPLLAGNRAYLVFDRNDDGRVDDGRELFGPVSGDGFAELAALDADRNGWIDAADPGFAALRVWQPQGDDALRSLREAGVGALSTAAVDSTFALRGTGNSDLGQIRSTGLYVAESGDVRTLQQIDLSV